MGKMICIEGNIGAGKSTLLRYFEMKGYCVFQENIEDWKPYLNLAYTL